MSRSSLLSTLESKLQGIQRNATTYFDAGNVKTGRPIGLSPFDKQCIYYSTGDGELPEAYREGSLRTAFLSERFVIKVFWQAAPLSGKNEDRVLESWDVRRAITAALRADSQLGGNCSDLKIRSTTQEPEEYGEKQWDVLTITFDVWDLTGEAISA